MNISREIKAKSTLAMALVKNLITLPLRPSGASAWLGKLAEENLTPTAPDTWGRLEGTSRCIACGLCDVVDPEGEPVSAILMAASRRPEDAPLVLSAAQRLTEQAEAIAAICPAGVPAAEVAKLIEDNAAAITPPVEQGKDLK